MHQIHRPMFATIGAVLVFGLGLSAPASAQESHDHGAPLHGGKVAMTKAYHFEVVFAKDGVKVYPRTHEDKPLDASKLSGTATFYHPNSPKPWFDRPLNVTAASPGHSPESLGASVDTSTFPAKGIKVALKVSGLPDPAESAATFDVPFTSATSGAIVFARATKADEKAIAAQKTCPVSKEELDSMGGPLKVSRGGKSTFICCQGCLKQIQADPDKYLAATETSRGR
jgi:YHS domain-containing protein